MRKLISTILFTTVALICQAQTDGISYQALITNSEAQEIPGLDIVGNYLSEEPVDLRFTIYNAELLIEYQEVQSTVTDKFGMINLVIGQGMNTGVGSGEWTEIEWDGTPKKLVVELDIKGNGFVEFSSQELLFVPYGYHRNIYAAGTLEVDGETTLNNDITVENQSLTTLTGDLNVLGSANFNGNTWFNTITVEKWSLLRGTLSVGDSTSLDGPVHVLNAHPVDLSGTLNVEKPVTFHDSFDVLEESPSTLSGTLTVSKAVNLHDSLKVLNAAPVNFSGTLSVEESVTFHSSFDVLDEGLSYLSGSLMVDGETNLNQTLHVNNSSPVFLSGDLAVDGISIFNDSADFNGHTSFNTIAVDNWSRLEGTLTVGDSTTLDGPVHVLNAHPVDFSGTLNVENAVTFQSSLDVLNESPTRLSGSLRVNKVTNLNDSLNVLNAAPSHLSGMLMVDGESTFEDNVTVNAISDLNGQVTISAAISETDANNYGAYPLRVGGSGHGIAIKATASTPDGDNNFITFFNSDDEAVGRIEGQKAIEVATSPEYIFNNTMLVGEVAMATADLVGASASTTTCVGAGVCQTIPVISLIIAAGVKIALAEANLYAYNIFAYANLGVTYASGSADYAEWLLRTNPDEQMSYGDIVSVNGGKISKNTEYGDQMMVVSFKPAVLGNMPPKDEEYLYEKVAFLGQVPVKVKGKVTVGDYILPSGMHDGFGRAVHPSDMRISDYKKIVGVAWSASNDPVSAYINVAIGMNRHDLVKVVTDQQSEIDALQSELDKTRQVLAELVPGFAEKMAGSPEPGVIEKPEVGAVQSEVAEPGQVLSAEEMHPPLDRSVFVNGFELAKEQLIQQGIDVNTHPFYGPIFNNTEAKVQLIDKAMRLFEEQRKTAIEIDKAHGY